MLLLSRFWYFALAAAAMAAVGAAVLAQTSFNRQYDSDLSDQLRRDRLELELLLKMDARTRLDDIAPIAANSDVRNALRAASARRLDQGVDAGLRTSLERKLSELNRQLNEQQGELVFAVNDTGTIVAQIGAGDVPLGAGLDAFPLVKRALAGYLRDDVWIWNGKVYRMAARPVVDGGGYAGAIVHGKLVDDRLADRLASRLSGASIAFFLGERVIASHMPTLEGAPPAAEMAKPLVRVLSDPKLRADGLVEPVDLEQNGKGVYSLVTGSARDARVGYTIARPVVAMASPFDIFERASSDDVAALPWVRLILGALLLFGVGMLFLWLERDRPFFKLREATFALSQRKSDRINLADIGGSYRRIAEHVNGALATRGGERVGESSTSKRRSADLDQILGPTPGEGAAQPYFGFSARGGAGDVPDAPGAAPVRRELTPPTGNARPHSDSAATPLPGAPPQAPGMKKGPPPPAPKSQSGTSKPGWARSTLLGTGGEPGSGSGPIQASALSGAHNLGGGLPSFDAGGPQEEDGITMVAQVPEALLAATGGTAQSNDEQHFRQVYEQFIAMKRECSESTAGLSYEKFASTLRKNRDQILSKHDASSVRFTVYIKEGKAALKATPIR